MYRIVFHGNIHSGHSHEQVRERLGKLFRIEDSERLDKLFSGNPVTIKKSLDEAGARKYLAALDKAGAVVEIDPPLPSEQDGDLDLADFHATSAHQDLSFNTVMQSFSNDDSMPRVEPADVQAHAEADFPPPPQRSLWPLAAGAGAALVVAAAIIFWPGGRNTPLAPAEQANLEQLFAIAGEGNDDEFRAAVAAVTDPNTRKAMFELREAMASIQDIPSDDPLPEFDMARLEDIALNSSDADFDAAVRDEADVDARRLLLELREQRK
ncbi:MAG: hypothetical protein ACK4SX_03005 [Alcanivoracaceae bacterium]